MSNSTEFFKLVDANPPKKCYLESSLGPNDSTDISPSFHLLHLNPKFKETAVCNPEKVLKFIPEVKCRICTCQKDSLAQFLNLKFFRFTSDIVRANVDCNTMGHLIMTMRSIVRRSNISINQILEANFIIVSLRYMKVNTKRLILTFICEVIITIFDPIKRVSFLNDLSTLVTSIVRFFLKSKSSSREKLLGLDTLVALLKTAYLDTENLKEFKLEMNQNSVNKICNLIVTENTSTKLTELIKLLQENVYIPDNESLLYFTGEWPFVRSHLALFDLDLVHYFKSQIYYKISKKDPCAKILEKIVDQHFKHDSELLISAYDEGIVDILIVLHEWGIPQSIIVEYFVKMFEIADKGHILHFLVDKVHNLANEALLEALKKEKTIGPKIKLEKDIEEIIVSSNCMIPSSDEEDFLNL